jgi:hypothetical protein
MNNELKSGTPIQVNIEQYDGTKPIEIVFREGAAQPIQLPIKVAVVGNIYAVKEFIRKNFAASTGLQPGMIIVSGVDKINQLPVIEFDSDPSCPQSGTKVKSVLVENNDFLHFHFNDQDSGRSPKQMITFLRQYAHCFDSIESVRVLIKALQNQEIKFEQIASQEDDRQGKVTAMLKEQIKITKGELPTSLTIKLPYFEGTPLETITAEIEIDRKGTTPVFSFYCLGIEAAVMQASKKLVNEQLEGATQDLFVIIYK